MAKKFSTWLAAVLIMVSLPLVTKAVLFALPLGSGLSQGFPSDPIYPQTLPPQPTSLDALKTAYGDLYNSCLQNYPSCSKPDVNSVGHCITLIEACLQQHVQRCQVNYVRDKLTCVSLDQKCKILYGNLSYYNEPYYSEYHAQSSYTCGCVDGAKQNISPSGGVICVCSSGLVESNGRCVKIPSIQNSTNIQGSSSTSSITQNSSSPTSINACNDGFVLIGNKCIESVNNTDTAKDLAVGTSTSADESTNINVATSTGTTTSSDGSIAKRLSSNIVLQVESEGEAWYIYPIDHKRYYLGRPSDALTIMKKLGLGISETNYNKFNGHAPANLSGRILIRAGANGEAYYVSPTTLKLYYLGRPADAFSVMKDLGLGISNSDLNSIGMAI